MQLKITANDVASAIILGFLVSAFSKFFEVIFVLIWQNARFKPATRDFATKLKSMTPDIRRIVEKNRELDRSEKTHVLMQLMNDSIQLVDKCSSTGKYSFIRKPYYLLKLNQLEREISEHTDMQLQMTADIAETLVEIRQQRGVEMKILGGMNLITKGQIGSQSGKAQEEQHNDNIVQLSIQ